MPDLLVLARDYDLPPRWDGGPVEWEAWQPATPMFICPPPDDMGACDQCGSLEERITAKGIVTPLPGVHRIGGHQLRAFRCPDCQHDRVWDSLTDDVFDLGPEDYGESGSWPPAEVEPAPEPENPAPAPVPVRLSRPVRAPRRTAPAPAARPSARRRHDGSCTLCDDLHAPGQPCGRPAPPPPGWRPNLRRRE